MTIVLAGSDVRAAYAVHQARGTYEVRNGICTVTDYLTSYAIDATDAANLEWIAATGSDLLKHYELHISTRAICGDAIDTRHMMAAEDHPRAVSPAIAIADGYRATSPCRIWSVLLAPDWAPLAIEVYAIAYPDTDDTRHRDTISAEIRDWLEEGETTTDARADDLAAEWTAREELAADLLAKLTA